MEYRLSNLESNQAISMAIIANQLSNLTVREVTNKAKLESNVEAIKTEMELLKHEVATYEQSLTNANGNMSSLKAK